MSKEAISLDKYNDMIQIDTIRPVPKSSYIDRCRQTIRMNYAADLNKLDILQRIDFKNYYISKAQDISSVLLLAFREYYRRTRKKDLIGRIYFNCNVLRDSKTNCDIFIPKHRMVINVDGGPHGLECNKENDKKNIPKYIDAECIVLLLRDESLDNIPNCINIKIEHYISEATKRKILKAFCDTLKITDILDYEFNEIIKLSKINNYYLTEDEIKRCELLYQDLIYDYDGYLNAWKNEKENLNRVA